MESANRTKSWKLNIGEFIIPSFMIIFVILFLVQLTDLLHLPQHRKSFIIVLPITLLVLFLTGSIIISEMRKAKKDSIDKPISKENTDLDNKEMSVLKSQVYIFLAVIVYVSSLQYVGFIIGSAVFAFLAFVLGKAVQNKILALVLAIFIPLFIYLVFAKFFNIFMPEGFLETYILENIIY